MVGKEGRGAGLQSHRLLRQPERICVCMQDVSDIYYDVLSYFNMRAPRMIFLSRFHSPSTSTMQEHSVFPPEFSAQHLYWPSSSGRALAMVREHCPPAGAARTETVSTDTWSTQRRPTLPQKQSAQTHGQHRDRQIHLALVSMSAL